MKSKSIFIKFPWTMQSNEIYLTVDQVKDSYYYIMNALIYKQKFNYFSRLGMSNEASKFDLSDIRVFNLFESETSKKILDNSARQYVMDCVRAIRDVNMNKRYSKKSLETLFDIFCSDHLQSQIIKEALANNPNQFINFLKLFKLSSKIELDQNNYYIKQIDNYIREYRRKNIDNIRM